MEHEESITITEATKAMKQLEAEILDLLMMYCKDYGVRIAGIYTSDKIGTDTIESVHMTIALRHN